MKPTPIGVWLPFEFSVALSAICLVTWSALPDSGAWVTAFICFLPMTSFFATGAPLQTRAHLQALEARVRQIEAGQAAGAGAAPLQRRNQRECGAHAGLRERGTLPCLPFSV